MIDFTDSMDHYHFLISKLKAMQHQRFPTNQIVDAYRQSKSTALMYLQKILLVAMLIDDFQTVKDTRIKIDYLNNLEDTINTGLLETQS